MSPPWVFLLSALFFGAANSSQRPNVVFILADDLGFTDVSFHGSQQIPTPNIDALAYDGIIMNNYYVQPLCTPTRSALLTSRYPIHTGLQKGVIMPKQPYGLPLNETILPQYLKELGYKTHIIGKWHLGYFEKEYTPMYRGFDSHFGYYNGAEDYWDHSVESSGLDAWGLDFWDQKNFSRNYFGQYSTKAYAERAESVIRNHDKSEPLFLYVPFQSVHSANKKEPLQAPYEYVKKMSYIQDKNRRMFGAMVSCMDDAVGNITAALHDRGLLNNTVIVFSTDNGGPAGGFNRNHASNYPLRGVKALLWEGGTRGASFVWSPLFKKSAYISNHMVHVTDWLPTLLFAAGYNMTKLEEKHLDGFNMWDTLSNNASSSPREEIVLNILPKLSEYALRSGNMKIIHGRQEASKYGGWIKPEELLEPEGDPGVTERPEVKSADGSKMTGNVDKEEEEMAPGFMFRSPKLEKILRVLGRKEVSPHPAVVDCGPKPKNASENCHVARGACLYDISKDPCEYNNLAPAMPDVVQKLLKKVKEYEAKMVQPINKPNDPRADPGKHHGVWMPWIIKQ